MKKKAKSKVGRKSMAELDKKGKLTLSIDRDVIEAAHLLPGRLSLSSRVEAFLRDVIAKSR